MAKQLKIKRTTAKSNFTRQANYIAKRASRMLQDEIKEEFTILTDRFRNVLNANEDYRVGLAAAEVAEQEADIEKSLKEAETMLAEARDIVQTNLWSRYGKSELDMAIIEAEEANDYAKNIPVVSVNLEAYEVLLTLLDRRLKKAMSAMSTWERWIPVDFKAELDGRVKAQRASKNVLEKRKD